MADIRILAPFILSWEAGFSDHPTDKGGATNKGVTIATWKSVGYDKDGDGDIDVDDLRLITAEDAVRHVMKPHYWDRWKADRIKSQSVANLVVDWVWASGKNGITGVQRILEVSADGMVGEKTLAALNERNARELFAEIKRARISFIEGIIRRDPSQVIFKKGWLNRLNCINYGSLTLNKKGKDNVLNFTDV